MSGTTNPKDSLGVEQTVHSLWTQVCNSEKEMLTLGAHVQNCAQKASDLHNRIAGIFESLQGNSNDTDPISKIQSLVRQSLLDLHEFQARLEMMQSSLFDSAGKMQDLQRNCEKLQKSARFFQVLALNMRIQAAMVIGGTELFDTMVVSTKQLAEDIASVESSVSVLIHQSLSDSGRAVELFERQLPLMSKSKRIGTENMEAVNLRIQNLQQNASLGSRDLQDQSTKLSQGISGVVISLQFQDRTRQRVEHIVASLNNADSLDANIMDALLVLIVAQLKDELSIIQNIEKQARKALSEVGLQLERMMSILDIQNGKDSANLEWVDLLQSLSSLVSVTIDQQKMGQQLEVEACAGLERFEDSAVKVKEFLNTIIAWKVKSKVLSLNSIILAGQLGERGVGLAVISQEIVRNSEELAEDVLQISEKASSVCLHTNTRASASTTSVDSEQLQNFIRKIRTDIEAYREQMNNGIFSSLLEDADHSMSSLQTVTKMVYNFESTIAVLEASRMKLLTSSENVGSSRSALVNHPLFNKIHAGYTMAEERKIFASCFDQEYHENGDECAEGISNEVELF